MGNDGLKNMLDAFKTASSLVIAIEEELLSIREISENNRNELNSYRSRRKTLVENDKIEYEVFTPKTNKSRYQDEIESITDNVEELVETDRNLNSKINKLEMQLKDLIFIRDSIKESTISCDNRSKEESKKTASMEKPDNRIACIKSKADFCLKAYDLDKNRCQLELVEIMKLCK